MCSFVISDERVAEIEEHLESFHSTRYLIYSLALFRYDQKWIDETDAKEIAKLILEFEEEEIEYFDWMEFGDGLDIP